MSDQCALNESGSLKEAIDIDFFFSESETTPLPSSGLKNPGNAGEYQTLLSLSLQCSHVFLRASTWWTKEECGENVFLNRSW